MFDPGIRISEYHYELPPEKVAQFPLPVRDSSKLLIYRNGKVADDTFVNLGQYLHENSMLVFNDTQVIHARLDFQKPTGGHIEIFCLEPLTPVGEVQEAFRQTGWSTWKCLVGNLKRWKSGSLQLKFHIDGSVCQLSADRIRDCSDGCFEIAFRWNPPKKTFSEILEYAGLIPLPPYIGRPAELADIDRYQTVYACQEGSVAAPTAGLHFTTTLLEQLQAKGMKTRNVTLHVGIGTFRPVSSIHLRDHIMHHEKIVVSLGTLEDLVNHLPNPIIAVGTTSARTIESLFWLGANLISDKKKFAPVVNQWDPYPINPSREAIPVNEALEALIRYLKSKNLESLTADTHLMIIPGYSYRLVSGLLTNFHLPQSTLLLLVAALIGPDWERIYNHALIHGFRFLSYGDACLLMPSQDK